MNTLDIDSMILYVDFANDGMLLEKITPRHWTFSIRDSQFSIVRLEQNRTPCGYLKAALL